MKIRFTVWYLQLLQHDIMTSCHIETRLERVHWLRCTVFIVYIRNDLRFASHESLNYSCSSRDSCIYSCWWDYPILLLFSETFGTHRVVCVLILKWVLWFWGKKMSILRIRCKHEKPNFFDDLCTLILYRHCNWF